MTRQRRNTIGYTARAPSLSMVGSTCQQAPGAVLAISPSRMTEIEDIARLADLSFEDVPTLTLVLEGPVRQTQALISVVMEYPYDIALLLWKGALQRWRDLGYGFWRFKLAAGCVICLYGWWNGNWVRATFHLMIIGLCGLLSGLSSILVIFFCMVIIMIHPISIF